MSNFTDMNIQYNPEQATDDRPLHATLPEGAYAPRWYYKDKNTNGEWRREEHRRGYDSDTLEDLWGCSSNEAEFRCSFQMNPSNAGAFQELMSDAMLQSPEGPRIPRESDKGPFWGPPIKVHRGTLGVIYPMLMIHAPDWDQKNHGITKRDNSAQIRIVHKADIRYLSWKGPVQNRRLNIDEQDWDYRMNPHSIAHNPDGGEPYNFVNGDHAHLWRGNRPIILSIWKIRQIGWYFLVKHYGRENYAPSQREPGWYVHGGPWIFIDIKYGKDSKRLDVKSDWNESFGIQRISHNHVDPWKIYENSHSHMLDSRYFDRLRVDGRYIGNFI